MQKTKEEERKRKLISKKRIKELEEKKEEQIKMINNQEKIKRTREGVGFLIHKNIVGSCHQNSQKNKKKREKRNKRC